MQRERLKGHRSQRIPLQRREQRVRLRRIHEIGLGVRCRRRQQRIPIGLRQRNVVEERGQLSRCVEGPSIPVGRRHDFAMWAKPPAPLSSSGGKAEKKDLSGVSGDKKLDDNLCPGKQKKGGEGQFASHVYLVMIL